MDERLDCKGQSENRSFDEQRLAPERVIQAADFRMVAMVIDKYGAASLLRGSGVTSVSSGAGISCQHRRLAAG